ncbi:MAG TPA: hypothetical protein VKE24_01695 [Candidatus Acidoferrales bacterium]|nr:hypothetical protein [Candidatus Acidoferrales bacterium]
MDHQQRHLPIGVPASKGILNDDEIWAIVQYIRHLPPMGSLGEPTVYAAEPQGPAADDGDDRHLLRLASGAAGT